ncbi:dispatched-like protein [Monosiga brevicollis MX1]|uniref:Dispatched-like protein n=1 Tax=Monosiga brevicollis TaxID=81824 RepID=A9UYA9_MONBE|nr:dispatched-like protein [Monosiga brevicollis MX1]EDQ89828.1 dispatched-like protein [Monosiga brevicollis MX1]|eukprot:XP_001745250.1 dispatched-like protein [Monosiga brevicollis MX1]
MPSEQTGHGRSLKARVLDTVCELVVMRPIAVAGSVMSLAFLLTISTLLLCADHPSICVLLMEPNPCNCVHVAVGFVAYPFEIDTTGTTFVPKSSEVYRVAETFLITEEKTRFNPYRNVEDLEGITVAQQTIEEYLLTMIVVGKGGANILTTEGISLIKSTVDRIRALQPDADVAGYSDVCLRGQNTGECAPLSSLLKYFYATEYPDCPGVFNPDGKNSDLAMPVEDVLRKLIDPSQGYTFCTEAVAPACNQTCMTPNQDDIASYLGNNFGYANTTTLAGEPNLESDVTRLIMKFGMPLAGYNNSDDRFDDQQKIIEVAIVIVGIYVIFHTQSLFLGLLGMLHILISFPVAYLFGQAAMDFGGMGILNLMALFIILGIGADDIFIVVDGWKQSQHEVSMPHGMARITCQADEFSDLNTEWLKKRMRWAYARAAQAMLITSLTTGAAFVMNLTSTVPAIQIFGGFTAFMVLFNYLLVISFYPAIVIIYQRHAQYWVSPLSFCVKSGHMHAGFEKSDDDLPQAQNPVVPAGASNPDNDRDVSGFRGIERFFYKTYAPFIYKQRFFITAGFVLFFIITIIFAAQLEASETPAQWLPKNNHLQQTLDILDNNFGVDEDPPQVAVFYGVNKVSTKSTNPYNPNDVGKLSFYDAFDPSSPAAQEQFIELCELYRAQSFVFNKEVICPMEEFRDFQLGNGEPFPVPQADFAELLGNFTQYYEFINGPAPDYSGFLESSIQDAETRETRRQNVIELFQLIRFDIESNTPVVRSMAIAVTTTLSASSSGKTVQKVYDAVAAITDEQNDLAENQAFGFRAYHTSDQYLDMVLEQTLLSAAVTGIGASLALAFVIIVLTTHDLVLSVMAIVAIGGVVTTLIAFIVWLGWSLTVIESICLTILVGLSVDYVIHLGVAYQESKASTRFGRMRDALVVMGISVFSASVTTLLAAIVLTATTIIFFFKFGLFIMLTILASTLWSFGFMMSWLSIMGRTDHHNDLKYLWRKLLGLCGRAPPDTPPVSSPKASVGPSAASEHEMESVTSTVSV